MLKRPPRLLAAVALCLATGPLASAADPLRDGFQTPPDSAKPQTWWHWMNGNITKPGITADLEAMREIGLGGATIVNVDCGVPRGPVPFMSPQWRDDFKFAVAEANRLGLQLCVENCAGWSSSGGPWNTPANAMQRLTSTEATVDGPAPFDAPLAQPPTTLATYHDIAVLAFRVPAPPAATATAPTTSPARPVVTRAVYEAVDGGPSADVTALIVGLIKAGQTTVVASNDQLGGDPAAGRVKRLRVEYALDGRPQTLTVDEDQTLVLPANTGQFRKARAAAKTAVDRTFVRPPRTTASRQPVAHDSVLNLTAKLAADGRLRWDVPPGRWTILRLGYTPIGIENHPAPKEGTGLECDKMSQAALDAHWAGFMQKVLDDVGPLAGKALDSSLIDSYEVGGQDWTPRFREEFQRRRGYDPLPYLITFTRHVVDSPAVTERFLWDVRRTVADLFADNYYAHFSDLCHQHGLSSAVEPYTGPFESLQSGRTADVVMGEFWTGSDGHPSVKMCASIAHIYGKTIASAESFTADDHAGRWQSDPYSLKALGDLMYCQGLNRYTFHRYAMQPWNDRLPGMTMGPWGLHFERTLTWWNQGKAWIDYISRCQYLLQQGRAVADVAYFTGESAPVEMRVGQPAMPAGYDYDAVNADVLLHGATVQDGRVKLASGVSYGALVLPPGDANVTPATLAGLARLVRDGATLVGPRPRHSPSLADYPNCDAQVTALTDELWGPCDGRTVLEHAVGKGRIVWGKPLADVLAAQRLGPDFEGGTAPSQLAYVHRVAGDADLYFVSNQRHQFEAVDCTFRVSGKVPELWHPDTGVVEAAPVWSERDGRTTVRLPFEPAGSVFVVFRQAAGATAHAVSADGAMAAAAAPPPALVIGHAVYAAVDGSGELDVTAKLAGLARDGRVVVLADNDHLGRDPAYMHPKELRVDYTLGGKPGHVAVPEHETLTLPPIASEGSPPPWEAGDAADGSPVVRLWADGQVVLHTAAGPDLHAVAHAVPAPQELAGPWALTFPPKLGAPPSVTLDALASWTEHPDAGVRYFSGTATYRKEIDVPADRLGDGRELWVDLGRVENLAEVSLNGRDLGVLWKPPFRVNVTGAARPGANQLVVKVTNLWPNRIIGDEQLPPDCEWDGNQLKGWPQWFLDGKPSPTGRVTFSTWHHWKKDSPLLESGLIGPVTLRSAAVVPAR